MRNVEMYRWSSSRPKISIGSRNGLLFISDFTLQQKKGLIPILYFDKDGENTFKMGRSTGKHFKEKGLSLYKDKEISTTHAKVNVLNLFHSLINLRKEIKF